MSRSSDNLSGPVEGLLLVGHGTRHAGGVAELWELVDRLARLKPQWDVSAGFLELAEPSLSTAIDDARQRGLKRLVVAPLLLLAAGHAKRDIPAILQEARERWPELELHLADHLGCHEKLLELSARRYRAALAGKAEVPAEQTLLLMVGRGSHDAEALAEMQRFAELCRRQTPVGGCEVCYLAMADPSLEQAIETAGNGPYKRVVVQPHLLLRGELLDRLGELVCQAAGRWNQREWVLVEHLGPDGLLAEAVIDQAEAAGRRRQAKQA